MIGKPALGLAENCFDDFRAARGEWLAAQPASSE